MLTKFNILKCIFTDHWQAVVVFVFRKAKDDRIQVRLITRATPGVETGWPGPGDGQPAADARPVRVPAVRATLVGRLDPGTLAIVRGAANSRRRSYD